MWGPLLVVLGLCLLLNVLGQAVEGSEQGRAIGELQQSSKTARQR